ncbi:hypothetical protein EDB85DRAFT_1895344 [Lactarius pseudohatsudake]|nr:hypothetical protein EDB85DRAFT_1895344 [Lactarius pseudohatsudake]
MTVASALMSSFVLTLGGKLVLAAPPCALSQGRPRNGLLTSVTFRLRNHLEFPLPPEDLLGINGLTEPPDREAPDFVKQLEEELCLQRSPSCHGAAPPLLGSLNTLLGESLANISQTRATSLRCALSLTLNFFTTSTSSSTINSRAKARIGTMRGRTDTLWPFSLVVEDVQNDALYRHTPRSDFSMVVKGFRTCYLGEGARLMLLQASCLVRLGNALLAGGSSTFFVKVIYVDRDYHAVEYTLYQRGPKPCDDSDDKVAALLIVAWKEWLMLALVLCTTKFPRGWLLRYHLFSAEVEYLPYLTGGHGCGRSGSSAPTSLDGQCSSETAATLLNPRVREAVERGGYTLLPGGSTRLKPTVGKAISHDISPGLVALKLLDGATEELQILQRLLAFQSEANHAIKLLDVIELNTELSSRCHVIVMPWQMTLAQCLEEKHFPLRRESLRVQFLEGVAFLHEHGVAHLDLKPGNVLVHGSSGSLSPRLSIIDFGLSVIAESEETLVEGYHPWGVRAEKCGGEVDEATAARKRHRVVCVLRAQLQIHVQMQPSTGTGAPRRSVQCIATPYRAGEVQSGCTFYFYITSFLCLYCRST